MIKMESKSFIDINLQRRDAYVRNRQDVQIPDDLAPGFYLLRSELLALHEADVSHEANPNRGVQIYISCVQLEVIGNGTTPLPTGVSFPGAYE